MCSYVYALRPCTSAPPNCSIQNKKIRNSEYYKEKKESLKAKKVRYDFKIELKKEEEDRLESLKMKIASIKKELHLDNKLVPATNARFMEILVDNWLVHNAKTDANGLDTAGFVDFDSRTGDKCTLAPRILPGQLHQDSAA